MLEMADVKPTVLSWLIVGLLAVSFFAAAKWTLNTWKIPYVTDFVNFATS